MSDLTKYPMNENNHRRVIKENTVIMRSKSYTYYTVSDIGVTRKENQDSFVSIAFDVNNITYLLSFVCDGMGGHQNGLDASLCVRQTLIEELSNAIIRDEEGLLRLVEAAIRKANRRIYNQFNGKSGTTVVGVLLDGLSAYWWSVGDSRIYATNHGHPIQISKDHSLVQKMVDNNELTPEEAKTYPKSNVLLRALGTEKSVKIDMSMFYKSSNIVLCSDGFWHHLKESEKRTILSNDVNLEFLNNVFDNLIERGERDNITAVIIKETV